MSDVLWCEYCKVDHPLVGTFGEFKMYACPMVPRGGWEFRVSQEQR